MFDLPPDVPRLRVIEQQLTVWLGHVRKAIAEAQAAEAIRANTLPVHSPPVAYRLGDPRPIGGRNEPPLLHAGDCRMGGGRPITREQALQALTGDAEPCPYCRPDTELGVL
ncbi:DUF6233 domain-containing protein [Streptomyces sp. NPDC058155]|uniref:DUF6233 domain-containing protein n=1 Tax=Streptomyces sp. NPDC058155 TaxID=3346359 RepID=UPI0036EED61E